MRAYLVEKLLRVGGPRVDEMLDEGRFVDDAGRAFRQDSPFTPQTFVFFHRDLRSEPEVPGEIVMLHSDDRIVVTVELSGTVEIRAFDIKTMQPTGRLRFATEP